MGRLATPARPARLSSCVPARRIHHVGVLHGCHGFCLTRDSTTDIGTNEGNHLESNFPKLACKRTQSLRRLEELHRVVVTIRGYGAQHLWFLSVVRSISRMMAPECYAERASFENCFSR